MLRPLLALVAVTSPAFAQSVYDFNALTGTDTHPYTLLDQQDGWSEQTFNARNRCGVTATLSHDGTQSLRFQEVGPGYGCDASRINDAAWSFQGFSGTERGAYFEADMLVGYWGGSFGLAQDANRNGQVRSSEAGELGVRFTIGTQANVQLRLVGANGTYVLTPLAGLGITGGHWVRIRVAMDFLANGGAGLGDCAIRDITAGDTAFRPVPGLQRVPLGLDPNATDAKNPTTWNAMWLHFEGATYGLDNIAIGDSAAHSREYGSGCGSLALHANALPVLGGTAGATTEAIPASSPAGFVLVGFTDLDPGIDLTPIGMPGCLLQLVSQATIPFAPTGSTAQHTLSIPNNPALVGGRVHLQSIVADPSANALGLIASNGLTWIVGLR